MQALQGITWLLVLQLSGEALARLFRLPFPGPVIGMLLLVLSMRSALVRAPVQAAASYLLSHLSLLFVPVGVGVITHLSLLRDYGLKLLVVIAISTWAGMIVTVLLTRALLNGPKNVIQEGTGDA